MPRTSGPPRSNCSSPSSRSRPRSRRRSRRRLSPHPSKGRGETRRRARSEEGVMTMRRIFSRLAWLAIAMTAAAGTALAGGNPNFTLPLHAKVTQGYEPCEGYLPVDCLSVHPTVEVQSGQSVAIFLLVANAPELTGVQTAFDVDPSW